MKKRAKYNRNPYGFHREVVGESESVREKRTPCKDGQSGEGSDYIKK